MFARLVYNPGVPNSAQTVFATVINILTGTTTANTQLDPFVYNQTASYIVNGAGPGANTGWYVVDSQANLVANAIISSYPVVIGSPWSDNSFYGKYLYLAPAVTSNNTPNFVSIPMDGWQANTKWNANGANIGFGNTVGGSSWLTSGYVFNTSNNVSRWYDFINLGTSPTTTVGITSNFHTTILSSSNTHLLIANFVNASGYLSGRITPVLTNYFFLSEYSRDDAYNTAASGFPSWFAEGASVPSSYYLVNQWLGQASQNTNNAATAGNASTYQHFGILSGMLNTISNTVSQGASMFKASINNPTGGGYNNWGITTRFYNWAVHNIHGNSITIGPGGTTSYSFEGINLHNTPPFSRGLSTAANIQNFLGNQNLTRDINKNPAVPIAELRLTSWNQDTSYGANNIWSGGSISGVTPYLYATSARFNNFDEITLGGNTYMVINFNQASAAYQGDTNFKSNILILER